MGRRFSQPVSLKGVSAAVGLTLAALACVTSASAGDSLRVRATDLGGNTLLVGRYHIPNPPYCLARKPSYSAPNYDEWVSPKCVPYTVQRADFVVTVLYEGRRVHFDSFRIDGASGNPSQGGTFIPYYIYCGLLANASVRRPPKGTYYWTVTLIDPFHRPGYNVSRRGPFTCR
jgi:hypothetical protein